jgi:hypothetical protein
VNLDDEQGVSTIQAGGTAQELLLAASGGSMSDSKNLYGLAGGMASARNREAALQPKREELPWQ